MAETQKKAEKPGARKIKKYANRKLYDTTDKKYVSLDRLSELIKAGEEVTIEDNETGEDITAAVVSQLLAREKKDGETDLPVGMLMQLLRKGRGTVAGYAKKYAGLWQGAVTMAEDEIDKLVSILVKDKEISESEGFRLKREMMAYADGFKKWVGDKVDQRVNEVMGVMNLATKDQVVRLTEQIEALTETVERLEAMQTTAGKPAARTAPAEKRRKKASAEAEANAAAE